MEFKIGQTVRIKKNAKEIMPLRYWNDEGNMDSTLGETGRIIAFLKSDSWFGLDSHDSLRVRVANGAEWCYMPEALESIEEPKPEPKYPIITTHMGEKVVFNPPYTIVICELKYQGKNQRLIGKAKCHPTDTYDKWEGYKIAHERMTKAAPCTK